jgi:hypothetical protein
VIPYWAVLVTTFLWGEVMIEVLIY